MERKIFSENQKIFITNLDIFKRPINSVADNQEVRNAKSIKIKINKKKFQTYHTIKIIV